MTWLLSYNLETKLTEAFVVAPSFVFIIALIFWCLGDGRAYTDWNEDSEYNKIYTKGEAERSEFSKTYRL